MLTCTCGYRGYVGYLQEFAYLSQRRQWLWDRITEQSGPPAPGIAQQYGIWQVRGAPAPAQPPRGGSTQLLLIGLGATLLILAGMVFVAVAWELVGPIGQLLFMVLASVICAAAAVGLRGRIPRTAEALAVVSFALAWIVVIAVRALGAVPEQWTQRSGPYWLVSSMLLMALSLAVGTWSGLRAWLWTGWLSAPGVVAAALGIVGSLVDDAQVGLTIAALAYLVLAVLLLIGLPRQRTPMFVTGALSLVAAVGLTFGLLTSDPPIGAIITIAAALLSTLLLHEHFPAVRYFGWPLFGVWLALLAMLLPVAPWTSVMVGLAGAALLLVLGRSSPAIAVTSSAALWTTWLATGDAELWQILGIAGLAFFALSVSHPAAPVAWLGAGALEAALLLQWSDVPFFEAPVLVFAGLLLAAGAIQRRAGQHQSMVVYGPAVAMALIPTSLLVWLQIWEPESLVRFVAVMTFGIAVLLVGVNLRLQGLVIPSAIAIGIAAAAQVHATLDLLPRWLSLGIAGVVLIAVGARIEWVRARGQQTDRWLRSLT